MGFFHTIAEAFTRDGVATTFCEKLPVIGLATAGIQALAGNGEHAKRALATSTGSLVTTVGAVGGFMLGGPVGAVAGGAAASQLGIAAEWGISKTINDDKVKGNVGDVSVGRMVGDGALAGLGGLIGGGGASAVGKQAMQAIGREVGKKIIGQSGSAIVTGVVTALGQAAGKSIQADKKNPDTAPPEVDSDTDDEKKHKRRVCTKSQENQAQEVAKACRKILQDWKAAPFDDIFGNLLVIESLREGWDWQQANEGWTQSYQIYAGKKIGQRDKMVDKMVNDPGLAKEPGVGETLRKSFEEWLDKRVSEVDHEAAEMTQRMLMDVKYVYH